MTMTANRLELLQVAEAVAREKGIARVIVLQAMEEAIERAARFRFGSETHVKAEIDTTTGELRLMRLLEVVEDVESFSTQISLKDALLRDPKIQIGGVISEPLPPMDFGRVAAQSARQVILQKVREAERLRQYEAYKNRCGEIISGVVKRVEYRNVIVDLEYGEAIIRHDETIPREVFHAGERVRAYLYDVRHDLRGPQVFLSRTHPQFLVKLFAQEVPEVYEGIVEICAVARDPGSRAKIGVVSKDASIDPVGACVGLRGSRVQAVVSELRGEKIDIIPWSADPVACIVNALQPAEVAKVVLDEEARRIDVVVPKDQLSFAIGRRGQNVRLAAQLTGWSIDLMSEEEESELRQKEFSERSKLLMETLNVDELVAQLLVSEGFTSVTDLVEVSAEEIAAIEGFEQETAEEIQERARRFLAEEAQRLEERRLKLGVSDALKTVMGLTPLFLTKLGEAGIKTLEDFAGCTADDLVGWNEKKEGKLVFTPGIFSSSELSRNEAEGLILSARLSLGWITSEDFEHSSSEEEARIEEEKEGEIQEEEGENGTEVEGGTI